MTTATPAGGDYDAYSGQYAAFVARREQAGPEADPYGLLPPLLDLPPGGRFPRYMLLASVKDGHSEPQRVAVYMAILSCG